MTLYDPNAWVTSLQRSLKEYTEEFIYNYIKDNASAPVGDEIFDVRFDWPDANDVPEDVEFERTIIHFLISQVQNRRLGIGDNMVEENITAYDVEWAQASVHQVEFEIGVWASDKSGGVTNRLVAYEMLVAAFHDEIAKQACMEATQGVEIMSFDGGRFIQDTINDIRVFRVVDTTLRVRVFSRRSLTQNNIVVDEIVQAPDLSISGIELQ